MAEVEKYRVRWMGVLLLVGAGIPTVLLLFVAVISRTSWALERTGATAAVLNAAVAALAAAGLGAWWFFSFILFRRLWKVYTGMGEGNDPRVFGEGVCGLLGVGVSMSAVLGLFFYLFTGDAVRSYLLIGLSYLLAAVEAARLEGRMRESVPGEGGRQP